MMELNLKKFSRAIEDTESIKMSGKVTQVIGLVIESKGPNVSLGELCYIKSRFPNVEPIPAEVVGFREGLVLLMPIGEMQGIGPGCEVISAQKTLQVKVGMELLGRVLDGLGNPMDGKGPILSKTEYPLHAEPPDPLQRPRIKDSLYVGVRAIDGLITLGSGQRIGIMAGSGVGKSTLLSMIARNTEADISVISLVGERGREVRDFIERDLGEEGLKRSVVVVATSDKPALVRIKGAMTATAIAEYFRDQGRRVARRHLRRDHRRREHIAGIEYPSPGAQRRGGGLRPLPRGAGGGRRAGGHPPRGAPAGFRHLHSSGACV